MVDFTKWTVGRVVAKRQIGKCEVTEHIIKCPVCGRHGVRQYGYGCVHVAEVGPYGSATLIPKQYCTGA